MGLQPRVRTLAVDRFVAIVRTDRNIGAVKSSQLKDLASNRLITLNPSPSIRRHVEQVFAEARLAFEPRYQVARQTTALGRAEAGLGIALLPETRCRNRVVVPSIKMQMLNDTLTFVHFRCLYGSDVTPF